LNVVANVGYGLLKGGRWVATFGMHQNTARKWTDTEIWILEETAERTWAAVERAKAEKALRISESRLQRMVNVPKVGVLTFSNADTMLHANDAFLNMIGYSRQEFENNKFTWRDFTPPEHVEASLQFIDQLEKTGVGGPYEKEYHRKDGSRIWLMFVAADLGDGTLVEYAVDVSDRKEAEQALRQLTEHLEVQVAERTTTLIKTTEQLQKNLTILQQAEDLAQIGSWEYAFATKSFTWSKGMYELFGLPGDVTVEPEVYITSAVPDDADLAAKIAKGIREGILPLPKTVCIQVGEGTRLLKIEAAVVRDAAGVPVRVIGVDLDITGPTEAAKTLGEQAHFIQSTNEALPDILFVMDLHTKNISYINHSFEERLGFPATQAEETGKNILSIIYEEDVPAMLAHFEEMKTAADGVVYEVEYRLKAADGVLHWFRDRNAVFKRDKTGVPTEKIGIAQDITERKKIESDLRESNTSLRYANENLQQFASIASHDLQEPLRKIKLFASVIEKNWTALLPAEGRNVIQKIMIASDRMSQLIREVLQYSKIAYGEKNFIYAELYPVLQNVLSDLDLLLEDAGAVVDYPASLPVVEAIPLQMHQLFYNLLTNAVKFRTKEEKLLIQISANAVPAETLREFPDLRQDKSYVEVVVSDNGIGFEQEYADQIFQIFERLHSVEDYEGTGVGLALCKKIVENHSGHIYAVSGGGKGASFHILLPEKQ
ncbi:MAG TPA: PAS domain-containing protein, partial [Flavisolibacter sp.]|nr:PAS domain-containing protein [Flavisolibacter sp.]